MLVIAFNVLNQNSQKFLIIIIIIIIITETSFLTHKYCNSGKIVTQKYNNTDSCEGVFVVHFTSL